MVSDGLPVYVPDLDEGVKQCRGKNMFFSTGVQQYRFGVPHDVKEIVQMASRLVRVCRRPVGWSPTSWLVKETIVEGMNGRHHVEGREGCCRTCRRRAGC